MVVLHTMIDMRDRDRDEYHLGVSDTPNYEEGSGSYYICHDSTQARPPGLQRHHSSVAQVLMNHLVKDWDAMGAVMRSHGKDKSLNVHDRDEYYLGVSDTPNYQEEGSGSYYIRHDLTQACPPGPHRRHSSVEQVLMNHLVGAVMWRQWSKNKLLNVVDVHPFCHLDLYPCRIPSVFLCLVLLLLDLSLSRRRRQRRHEADEQTKLGKK